MTGPVRRRPFPERPLLVLIRAGIALAILTPLVVTPETLHPFVVGKAVYSRSVIEVTFALWTLLALARPAWRPPASMVLLLLGAGLAVAALAGWFGASPQRSLWSTYARMQGVVDLAHWFALALVLASMVRTPEHLRALLNANLAVGVLVALVAVASYYRLPVPLLGLIPEEHYPRVAATLGNPTFLGGHMAVIVLLAWGFFLQSFVPAPDRPGRRAAAASGAAGPGPDAAAWAARSCWAATGTLALWALSLSGSMGAMAGVAAGAGCVAFAYGLLARERRSRLATLTVLGVLAAGALAGAWLLATEHIEPSIVAGTSSPAAGQSGKSAGAAPEVAAEHTNPLLHRVTSGRRVGNALGKRLDLWQAGIKGFAERPILGWGTENFIVPFGRHTSGWGGTTLAQDRAHSQLVEEAATRGVAGLVAYLALWTCTFLVAVRAARVAAVRERTLILFVAGALAGHFVHAQTLFGTATSSLQHVLLLAFVVHLETAARVPAQTPPGWRKAASFLGHPALRGAAAILVLALAGTQLAASRSIHSGAEALQRAEGSERFMAELEASIEAFDPLATQPRMILFENLAANWRVLASRHRAEAGRLIRWADVEARAALRAEPANWRLRQALARMYAAAALTYPEYGAAARRHAARSRALAPAIDPLTPPEPAGLRPPAPARQTAPRG